MRLPVLGMAAANVHACTATKTGALMLLPQSIQSMFWISVILLCHFRTWLFLGYSLKLPTPSLSQPTPPKETVLAASQNWCPPREQVTTSVHMCTLDMLWVTVILIFQMGWVASHRGEKKAVVRYFCVCVCVCVCTYYYIYTVHWTSIFGACINYVRHYSHCWAYIHQQNQLCPPAIYLLTKTS